VGLGGWVYYGVEIVEEEGAVWRYEKVGVPRSPFVQRPQ